MTTRNRNLPRMKRTWAVVDASTLSVAAVGTPVGLDLLTNIQTNMDLIPHGVTASAIRLQLGFQLIGDALETADLSYGVAWVPDSLVAVGAAFPDPAEESFDWMAFGSIHMMRPDGATAASRTLFTTELRSDSMRKQGTGRRSLMIFFGLALMTATSVSVATSGRVLVLGL